MQESDEAHDFSGFILIAEKGPQPSSLWKCGNPRVRTMLQEHVTVLIHAKVYFDRSPYSDRTAVRTATGIAVLKVYDPTAPGRVPMARTATESKDQYNCGGQPFDRLLHASFRHCDCGKRQAKSVAVVTRHLHSQPLTAIYEMVSRLPPTPPASPNAALTLPPPLHPRSKFFLLPSLLKAKSSLFSSTEQGLACTFIRVR